MVKVGGSAPSESKEAKAARERAERDAADRKVGEIRRGVSAETSEILRRFGIRAATAGSPSAGNYVANGFVGAGAGSVNPSAASGGSSGGGFTQFSGRSIYR